MKFNQFLVTPAMPSALLLAALLLSACGDKEAEAVKQAAEAAAKAETAAKVKAAAAPPPVLQQTGGYEPTAEERVLGITRTKEEQDKINAESLAGMALPQVPSEAPPVVEQSAADAAK